MRISTQLVQVDVVVTDKKDKHVEDLTADDFELLCARARSGEVVAAQVKAGLSLCSLVGRHLNDPEKEHRQERDDQLRWRPVALVSQEQHRHG